MKLTKCPEEEKKLLSHAWKFFKSDFKKKWTAASYKDERFIKKQYKMAHIYQWRRTIF